MSEERAGSPYHTAQNEPAPHAALDRRGLAALLVCAFLWSFSAVLIKLANSGPDPLDGGVIAFYRSFLGGIVFLPAAIARRGSLTGLHIGWPIASVLAFTVMTGCFVIANTMTAAANAIVLQYTSAIWVFALGPLVLGERAERSDFAWLLLAAAGIAVILVMQWQTDLAGLLVALTAGLGYGALTVVLRGLRRVDPMVVVAMNFLGSAALLLPVAAWQGLSLTGGQWLLMLALGVGQMAVPYVLFSWALQRVAARHAALIVLLEALLNPVLTRAIIGEPIPTATLIGGPLILASVAGRIVWSAARKRGPQLRVTSD